MTTCRYCGKPLAPGTKCNSLTCKAKEELERYHKLFYQIERYKTRLRRVDGEYRRTPTVDYTAVRLMHSPKGDRLLELLSQMEEIEAEISRLVVEAEKEAAGIERKIGLLEYPQCEILAQYYLDFKTLEQIAVNLSLEYRYVKRLKAKAIENYAKLAP